MKQTIKQFVTVIKRPTYTLAALGFLFVAGAPLQALADGAAGGQVQQRSIRMSDNGVSGSSITSGVGSGANVTYRVKFTTAAGSGYTIKGVVLDFCSGTGTPFIGDAACPAPAGFTVGATPTVDTTDYIVNSVTDTPGLGGGWTTDSSVPSGGQTFKMSNSTGTVLAPSTSYTFAVTGVTNPSTLGTFYARLITYTTDSGSYTAYDHNTAGTYQDYGGFALSTANIVQVSAKVQETLSFCVTGPTALTAPTAPGPAVVTSLVAPADCTLATSPAITLGHGTNNTLDAQNVDYNGVFTIASTNALNGLVIRMHNSNACGGLSTDNGTTCSIPAVGSGAATPSAIVAGTAAFGMFCQNSATPSGPVIGTVDCDDGYHDATASSTHLDPATPGALWFGMDRTTVDDSVITTFGDKIASSTGPISNVTNQYDFAATASNVTPAGIYKANLAMIATGTF